MPQARPVRLPHIHHHHEEAFYVLDGELTLLIAEETLTVGTGGFALVPRGAVHRPSNAGTEPVHFFFITSGAIDGFFVEMSEKLSAAKGRLPVDELVEIGARWDTEYVGLPAAGPVTMHNEESADAERVSLTGRISARGCGTLSSRRRQAHPAAGRRTAAADAHRQPGRPLVGGCGGRSVPPGGQRRRAAVRALLARHDRQRHRQRAGQICGATLARPPLDRVPLSRQLNRQPVTSSFPSGHSASAAAFAVGVAMEAPLAGAAVGVLASAVAYSRVYVGVHYPGTCWPAWRVGAASALLTAKTWPRRPAGPVRARPAVGRRLPPWPAGKGLVTSSIPVLARPAAEAAAAAAALRRNRAAGGGRRPRRR